MHKAKWFKAKHENNKIVQCLLCPHNCVIINGKTGICHARQNNGGVLVSLSYNRVTSVHMDPIEKKPLYHFYPGSKILSIGTFGCNFKCSFCQNWEISQARDGEIDTEELTSEQAVALALGHRSIGIAYTYNEPLINYEWVYETSVLSKKAGLKNVLVTNGYINTEPLKEIQPLIDAANIDLKFMGDKKYEEFCKGKLAPVQNTIEYMFKNGTHIELTNLLIPGSNDGDSEISALVDWTASISKDIPLHFSRYFPAYELKLPATDMERLLAAYSVAKKKLNHVYLGNIQDNKFSDTICGSCGAVLVERSGYDTSIKQLKEGKCKKCGKNANIV